jgi:glucan phosphoethanolaminetransferase (alkaline phosphatase superfamily)
MTEGGHSRRRRLRATLNPYAGLRWAAGILHWGWVVPLIAAADILVRWRQALLWNPVEWVAYAASIVYVLLLLRVGHWAFGTVRRRATWVTWLGSLVVQGLLAFVLVTHFQHYLYFGVPPEVQSFTIVFDAPTEAWRAVSSQLSWLNIALLSALTLGLAFTWRAGVYHPPRGRNAALAAGVVVLLTPGLFRNVYEGRGNFLPSVNFTFMAARATQSYANGEQFHFLPVANRNQLPKIGRTQPYNVIFFLGESLRNSNVGYAGYPRDNKPFQQALFERFPAQSFVFRHCYSSTIRTNPSVPSTLSGLHPMEFRDKLIQTPLMYKYGKVFSSTRTFVLSSQSYSDYNYVNFFRSPLLDDLIYQENSGHPAFTWDGMDDAALMPFLQRNLDAAHAGQPHGEQFFGIVHLNNTHYPYLVPDAFRKWHDESKVDSYDNSILYQDSTLGQIFKELEQRHLLDNTILIYASDHGEGFGEHGRYGHAHGYPYDEMDHIAAWMYLPQPLAAQYGEALRTNTQRNVSNLDWVPTLLELLGLSTVPEIQQITAGMMGQSLLKPVNPQRVLAVQNDSDRALSQEGFGVIQGTRQFLFHPSAGIRVFDIATDPNSTTDLWPTLTPKDRAAWQTVAAGMPVVEAEVTGAIALQEKTLSSVRTAAASPSNH